MKIPEFKPSKHYLRDINLSCLAATVKNSELPTIAARHISEFKSDPKCEIYLRGKDPKKISVWQQEMLALLFEKDGLSDAVVKGMKECNNVSTGGYDYDDLEESEIQQIKQRGIEAFIMISMIAIDEITQEVIIKSYTIFDCVLDEHGMVFVLRDGRWCFEEGDYLIRVMGTFLEEQEQKKKQKLEKTWESVFPRPDPGVLATNDASNLFGVWRYNEDETARVRKLLGLSPREVKEAHSSGASLGWFFSQTTSESLSNGENACLRSVQYERRGNWVTVTFPEHKASALGTPEEYWCDGKLLISPRTKNVYTRAEESYRRPARIVKANTELADLLKQIHKDKSR